MEIRIKITTPKGLATSTQKKLKPVLLGRKQVSETWTNQEDNEIYWVVRGDIRSCLKIQRNVLMYDHIIGEVFKTKTMKKIAQKKLTPESQTELKDMLENQTRVEIIKAATAEEVIDLETQETFWEKIKKKFRKT